MRQSMLNQPLLGMHKCMLADINDMQGVECSKLCRSGGKSGRVRRGVEIIRKDEVLEVNQKDSIVTVGRDANPKLGLINKRSHVGAKRSRVD